ncbi:hypothetical protein MRB53_038748 [Persea americana]|nr:hypothetical protein MRB53_038748 [Persea americana]
MKERDSTSSSCRLRKGIWKLLVVGASKKRKFAVQQFVDCKHKKEAPELVVQKAVSELPQGTVLAWLALRCTRKFYAMADDIILAEMILRRLRRR